MAVVLCLFVWPRQSGAATTFGIPKGTEDTLLISDPKKEGAQIFTAPSDGRISSIKLWFKTGGSNAVVSILAHAAGSTPPFNQAAPLGTASSPTANGEEFTFTFSPTVPVTAGQKYVIYLKASSVEGFYWYGRDTDDGGYDPGVGNWQAWLFTDMGFSADPSVWYSANDPAVAPPWDFSYEVTLLPSPTVQDIADTQTDEDTPLGPININATTPDGTITDIVVTSSDPTLVPSDSAHLSLTGTGGSRQLTITPAANEGGRSTIITVTATASNGLTGSDTFVLTVNDVNDAPTIGAVATQTTNEDQSIEIPLTVNDVDHAVSGLTVTATSSLQSLVANDSIVETYSSGAWTLQITPQPDANGSTTITVSVSDGIAAPVTTSFTLNVTAVNDAPVISSIPNVTVNEGDSVPIQHFTISDLETAATDLTVNSPTSSNQTLVTNANLVPGGTGGSRTLSITPEPGQSGTTTVTVSVSDGSLSASDSFVLTVNSRPTLSTIATQNIDEDTDTGALSFTVGDAETPAGSLTVTKSSSNESLVASENIVLGGSGVNRTVTVTPTANASGQADITLTVSDGFAETSMTFQVQVAAVNDLPTISSIDAQTIDEDGTTGALSFTVNDVETAADSLVVTASSSNTTLLPVANVVLGGSGSARTVTVTPAAHQFGSAIITLSVSDGTAVTTSFSLTVNAVNDSPVVTAPTTATTNENTPTSAIAVTATDVDHLSSALSLTAVSHNTLLVPNANIAVSGSDGAWELTITPAANESGTAEISITVTDGETPVTKLLNLTVNAVDDPPTIAAVGPQESDEDTPLTINLSLSDIDTPLNDLTITAVSSNTTLLDSAGLSFGGTGGTRTLTMTPKADQFGSTTITVTVSDDVSDVATSFNLMVYGVADAPRATGLADQTIAEDTALALDFTVSDPDPGTDLDALTFSLSSDNQDLVKNGSIAVTGTGADRTLEITPEPNQSGLARIRVEITDDTGQTLVQELDLTVTPVNDPPVISLVDDQQTLEDTATGAIAFTISDVETAASGLTLTAVSSDQSVVANEDILLGGSDGDRTVTIPPKPDAHGTVEITLTVGDGALSVTRGFQITVIPVNDPPTFTKGADVTVPEDADPQTISDWATGISAGPGEGGPGGQQLTFTVTYDGPTGLFTEGPALAADGTLTFTPAPNANGTADVSVVLKDSGDTENGGSNTSPPQSFQIQITAVNDPPTISAIADQGTEVGVATPWLPFTVGDVETTDASALTVTVSSNNQALVPDSNITLSGTGANRSVKVLPTSGLSGTATITLAVSDGVATASTSFDLAVNNIFLSALTTSLSSNLEPAFDRSILTYTVRYRNERTLTVTPTAADPTAEITVNGMPVNSGAASPAISLSTAGSAVVVVSSPGGSVSKTYTIFFVRRESSNALLAGLSVSPGSLSSSFSPTRYNYQVTVPYETDFVSVSASPADSTATVSITGDGQMAVGENTIRVRVTAENGASQTYTIVVFRQSPLLSIQQVEVDSEARSATLSFSTSEPATATVGYGVNGVSERTASAGSGRQHSANLSGLLPNTTYQYRITAITAAGARAEVSGSFTTQAERPQITCPGGEIRTDASGAVSIYCPADEASRESVIGTLTPQEQGRPVTVITVSESQLEEALASVKPQGGRPPTVVIRTGEAETGTGVVAALLAPAALRKAAQAEVFLAVESGLGTLTLPPRELAELLGRMGESQLLIRITDLSDSFTAGQGGFTRQTSAAVGVIALLVQPDGSTEVYNDFGADVEVALPIDPAGLANPDLVAIYRLVVDDQGKVTDRAYVGGKVDTQTGKIAARQPIPANYVALVYAHQFRDVPPSHWAYATVQAMAARQVVRGMTPELFEPDGPVTRAQFAAMLVRALQLPRSQGAGLSFTDLTAANPLAADVGGAVQAGLMNGYTEGTFRPDAQISRQEMALVLTRLMEHLGLRGPVSEAGRTRLQALQDLPDVAGWALDGVQAAVGHGLMQGRPGERFDPEDRTSRAEAVTALKRLLDQSQE